MNLSRINTIVIQEVVACLTVYLYAGVIFDPVFWKQMYRCDTTYGCANHWAILIFQNKKPDKCAPQSHKIPTCSDKRTNIVCALIWAIHQKHSSAHCANPPHSERVSSAEWCCGTASDGVLPPARPRTALKQVDFRCSWDFLLNHYHAWLIFFQPSLFGNCTKAKVSASKFKSHALIISDKILQAFNETNDRERAVGRGAGIMLRPIRFTGIGRRWNFCILLLSQQFLQLILQKSSTSNQILKYV